MVAPSVDGLALSLLSEEGHLVCATTRGDGSLGDDGATKVENDCRNSRKSDGIISFGDR
jgi:NAD-dependent DNA ligase